MRVSVKPVRPRVTALFCSGWDGLAMASGGPASPSPALVQFGVKMLLSVEAVLESAIPEGAGFMDGDCLEEAMRAARLARSQTAFPLRVLVSGKESFNPRCLRGNTSARRLVYSTGPVAAAAVKAFEGLAEARVCAGEGIWPAEVLRSLSEEFGVRSLGVVGGGNLFKSLLQAGCVDELCLVLEPQIFGNEGGQTLTGAPGGYLPASVRASLTKIEAVGGECFTWWRLRYGREFAEKVDALELIA